MTTSKNQSPSAAEVLDALKAENATQVVSKKASSNKSKSLEKTDEKKLPDDYYSNVALAERFASSVKDTHRFILNRGEWVRYNDSIGIWEETPEGLIIDRLRVWLESEYEKAFEFKDHRLVQQALTCRTRSTLDAAIRTAREILAIRPEEMDDHPDLIVVANGVVDLRTATLTPFEKSLLMTKRIPHPYMPDATSWIFDRVLETIREDTHEWVQILTGQSLTGHQPSNPICIFLYGNGQNAKSSFLDIMEASAGEYAGLPPQSSLVRGNGGESFDLHSYRGIRQALVEELPEGGRLDTGAIKRLVGTTKMTARKLHKDFETFKVGATLWVTINAFPTVAETDWGTWRRLVVISFPFTYRKKPEDVVAANDKLADERVKSLAGTDEQAIAAALAWRIAGAKKWYDAKKVEPSLPDSIQQTTDEWRYRSDSILGWASENLMFDPSYFCLSEDLLDDFNTWSIRNGSTWGQKTFLERFTNHDVFRKNFLEYKRGRHSKLKQSFWKNPKDVYSDSRIAGDTCTHVKGVRFRTVADALVPDDASELMEVSSAEETGMDIFEDEEELTF